MFGFGPEELLIIILFSMMIGLALIFVVIDNWSWVGMFIGFLIGFCLRKILDWLKDRSKNDGGKKL